MSRDNLMILGAVLLVGAAVFVYAKHKKDYDSDD